MFHFRSALKHVQSRLVGAALYAPLAASDAYDNRRRRASRKFLIVRHSGKNPWFYRDFLGWLAEQFPQVRDRFELRLLPCGVRDWKPYALHVSWLQDPVEDWSPASYRRALQLAAECDTRGIPVINRVASLSNSVKSVCSRLIGSVGIRTPRSVPIHSSVEFRQTLCGLSLPLFVREDRGHAGPICFVQDRDDVRRLPLSKFRHPVAVEFIDVRDQRDGCFRKFRYFAAGERGAPRHLITANHWIVRPASRVIGPSNRTAELDYVGRADPNHVLLQAARRALGLDVCAFDYSYDPQGRLVVWEVNPYPELRYPKRAGLEYLRPSVERSFALLARLYLERAGLEVPERLAELAYCTADRTLREGVARCA